MLRDLNHRAFAQVIRVALERQPEQGHPALGQALGLLDELGQVRLVAGQQAVDQRQLHAAAPAFVRQCADVLGQARAAERVAGPQVVRRQVEARVLAEQPHHRLRIDAHAFADAADLVGKRHLRRVEGVAGVLNHLGAGPVHRRGVPAEKRRQLARERRAVVRADDGQRRIIEVGHRRALAQKFRIKKQA